MAKWRIQFDPPHSFATETGFRRAVHSADFRNAPTVAGQTIQTENVFLCPVTNTLMLLPSVYSRDFATDFKEMSEWRRTENQWKEVLRAATKNFANLEAVLIEITVLSSIKKIDESLSNKDTLVWALESKFHLQEDEGFTLHYHALGNEARRKKNWFYIHWDNIGLHFSEEGQVRVYEYDRQHAEVAPTLVEQFEIAHPGELINKAGSFTFLPVPGYGLAIYHTNSETTLKNLTTNRKNNAGRGSHLIKWRSRTVGDQYRLFESSPVRIGLNPYERNVLGYQSLTYPNTGSLVDYPFDIGYLPSSTPGGQAGVLSAPGGSNAQIYLYNAEGTDLWNTAPGRTARVKIDLIASGDNKRTPVVYGYGLYFDPVFATRNTTAVTVNDDEEWGDAVLAMKITDNCVGQYEISAKTRAVSSDIIDIMLRGDTTYLVQVSHDDGGSWASLYWGLATPINIQRKYDGQGRGWYECEWKMRDFTARFKESHKFTETALEGLTLREVINVVLTTSGFPGLLSAPARFDILTLPNASGRKKWRFNLSDGDDGEKIIHTALFLAASESEEYYLDYDWDNEGFRIYARPNNSNNYWILHADTAWINKTDAIAPCSEASPMPIPPEANLLIVEGYTETDQDATRIPAVYANEDSISNPSSPDYLGRRVALKLAFPAGSNKDIVRTVLSNLQKRICHKEMGWLLHTPPKMTPIDGDPDIPFNLAPNTYIELQDTDDSQLAFGVVIERVIEIDQAGGEQGTYAISDNWSAPLDYYA